MAEPLFRGIIEFLVDLGVYDVVLPFLLIFSVVFAILEKTKVLGVETLNGTEVTKKNLNSMIAFIIAFFVIASKQLVAIINEALANVVLVLLMIIMILMLVGSFYKKDDEVAFTGGVKGLFIAISIITTMLIFLHAIPTSDGSSNWLNVGWDFIMANWNANVVGGIVMVAVLFGFVYFIAYGGDSSSKGRDDS